MTIDFVNSFNFTICLILGWINLKSIDILYEVITGKSYTDKKSINLKFLPFYISISMWINIYLFSFILNVFYNTPLVKSILLSIGSVFIMFLIGSCIYIKIVEKHENSYEDIIQ